jgi:uncharacterized protein YprB with RNaseH-like and TPR domain
VASDVSLAELSRVIRRIEAKSRVGPAVERRASLESVVDGALEDTEAGRVLVVRRRFELDHHHGGQPIASALELDADALRLLARAGALAPAGRRLLYLDAETTGLAGGTGTYAFLVGVGFFDDEAFEVRQYFMRDLDEEPALLAALDAVFRQFDGLVTYNGAGFDLPLLETRFVLARRRFPGDVFHLDLLGPARRLWGARLMDCRLATLEAHVLRFARQDDLPGALIPSVYFEYLRRKHPGQLPRVFAHNRHDVLSLAALAGWVGAALSRAPGDDFHPEELVGLGRLWEMADLERGLACYRRAIDRGLPSPWRERVLLRLAAVEKRRTRWEEARALWEAAIGADAFDPRPWEEIAKLHEHRRRDLPAARAVVEEALARARRAEVAAGVLAAFEYRLRRLTRRLAPDAPGA